MSTPSVRRRRQLVAPFALALFLLFTLGSSAAQMIPGHPSPAGPAMRDELAEIARARWARIGELRAARPEERCTPAAAHELAKLLVMDGQWQNARAFAGAYEARCGADPEVERWGNAPQPRPRR